MGKPVFNRTNEKIEWAKYTWNPVVGCKNGCVYCYARDIANRFYGTFEPTFYPERLEAPKNTPISKSEEIGEHSVFVCSMADLFGEWVPDEWIEKVLEVVRERKDWNYLFLTKNPSRLVGIDWPANAWVGTTVDIQARVRPAIEAFSQIKATVKFVSVEPFMEEITFGEDLGVFDWVIIGGRSKNSLMAEGQPEWRWVQRLLVEVWKADCLIYFKPNLTVRPREYPLEGYGIDHKVVRSAELKKVEK